jgi:ABC-type antimicrobial peptide transport system permease subunit
VLRGALSAAALGLAAGIGVAAWGARRLELLLFEVSSGDPVVFLLASVTLLAIAGAASSVPAWRAARVNPRESLAAE